MRAALMRIDVVRECVDRLGEARGPLQRDLHLSLVTLTRHGDDVAVQRLARRVEVLHEVDQAALVQEAVFASLTPLIRERDLETLGEKCRLTEPREQRVVVEEGLLENFRVGPEGDAGTRVVGWTHLGDRRLGRPAVVGLLPDGAVAVHLGRQLLRQSIHHAHAHAVQATGHLVALAAELAAGVQHGEHHLQRALAVLVRHRRHGNAATVVGDRA